MVIKNRQRARQRYKGSKMLEDREIGVGWAGNEQENISRKK